jgi:regulator of sigma E protease
LDHILALPVWGMVFWGVLTFSILVFIHEGGHFLTARLFGVNVHEFMLGLPGPALRVHTKSGTAFGVTAIPLGGYVRIAGMEPGAEDELLAPALKAAAEKGRIDSTTLAEVLGVPLERASSLLVTLADYMAIDPATDDQVSYVSRVTTSPDEPAEALLARVRAKTYRGLPTWKRVVVLASGVAVNIVAAVLTFIVVLTLWGFPTPTLKMATVLPNSAAATVGVKPGDTLTALDGVKLKGWEDLTVRLKAKKPGDVVVLTYARDGKTSSARVVLGKNPDTGRAFLGVGPQSAYYGMPLPAAVSQAFTLTGAVFAALGTFLAGVIHPAQFVASLKDARSVVGISEMAAQAAGGGPLDYAWLVAFLSLSLGAMNILPIPPLDGGKVVMEFGERIAGRPLKREWALGISAAGTLLLFTLIGYLVYADIARMAGGH